MGHKHSVHRVSVVVNAPVTCGKIDISLSYWGKSCFVGWRKVIATFRFPASGWQNTSAQDANVPLGKLNKKDPNTLRVGRMACYVTSNITINSMKPKRSTHTKAQQNY